MTARNHGPKSMQSGRRLIKLEPSLKPWILYLKFQVSQSKTMAVTALQFLDSMAAMTLS